MGTLWARSGAIERDNNDKQAKGALAFFYQGGTQTPLTVYQDAEQTKAHTSPVVASGEGRWPTVFIPYTESYDIRVLTALNSQLYFQQHIANPNPVEVTGTIPTDSTLQTGDILFQLRDSTRSGFLRCNGGTMGNNSSNSSEMNSTDLAEPLFTFLYDNLDDTTAPLGNPPGPRASAGTAHAAFINNRNIQLPDFRGAGPVGLDTMGRTSGGSPLPRNAFTGLTFTVGNANKPGSSLGSNSFSLTTANLPSHKHAFSVTSDGTSQGHTHRILGGTVNQTVPHTHSGTTTAGQGGHTHTIVDDGTLLSSPGVTATDSGHTHPITDVSHSHTIQYQGTNVRNDLGQITVTQNPSVAGASTAPGTALPQFTGITGTGTGAAVITVSLNTALLATHLTAANVAGSQHLHTFTTGAATDTTHAHDIDFQSQGMSQDHNHLVHGDTDVTPPAGSPTSLSGLGISYLGTWYIKL